MTNKGTVWTVDDDRFIRMAIRVNLEHEGFEVVEFQSPQVLLEALEETEPPDVIITEFRMYNQPTSTDYIEMIQAIRDSEDWQGIPIVVVSRATGESDAESATVIGCDCYLTKPFWPEELVLTVRRFFRD